MGIALALHVLAAVTWVGGMMFAYLFLRPATGPMAPAERLPLWRRTFARFFPWVFVCIVTLLATGYWMVFAVFGGFANVGMYVHLMQGLGWLMMLIFLHVYFAPYRRLCKAVDAGDMATAGKALGQIRKLVGINTVLGMLVVIIAAGGRGAGWG